MNTRLTRAIGCLGAVACSFGLLVMGMATPAWATVTATTCEDNSFGGNDCFYYDAITYNQSTRAETGGAHVGLVHNDPDMATNNPIYFPNDGSSDTCTFQGEHAYDCGGDGQRAWNNSAANCNNDSRYAVHVWYNQNYTGANFALGDRYSGASCINVTGTMLNNNRSMSFFQ